MGRHVLETLIGAVVLLIAVVFIVFAYTSSGVATQKDGYRLKAKFDQVSGLSSGSDVRIGGIKVGSVSAQELDPDTYQAVLTFTIRNDIKIPEDTSAEIVSESLLGGKYVSFSPGGAEEMLKDGGEIRYTQSSVNFEALLGKFLFSSAGGGADKASAAEEAPAAPESSDDEQKKKDLVPGL